MIEIDFEKYKQISVVPLFDNNNNTDINEEHKNDVENELNYDKDFLRYLYSIIDDDYNYFYGNKKEDANNIQTKNNSCAREKNKKQRRKKKKQKLRNYNKRRGDWQCPNCKNINFSFRQICNVCSLNRYNSYSSINNK